MFLKQIGSCDVSYNKQINPKLLNYEILYTSTDDVSVFIHGRSVVRCFGITDVLRTQKAVERKALSEEVQKSEVDCWQEDGSYAKRNPLGHWFLKFPNGTSFVPNSTYYIYAIPDKEVNANPNL